MNVVQKKSKNNKLYGITRRTRLSRNGDEQVLWSIAMSRQGQKIARQFFANTYGSERRALDMALLFRDAVLRLLPPLTTHQRIRRPRTTTTGIPGVRLVYYQNSKPKAWIAHLLTPTKAHMRSFSVKIHGDEKAHALAVDARKALLREHPNNFSVRSGQASEHANAHFSSLLEDAQDDLELPQAQGLPIEAVTSRIEALQALFDQLKPSLVHVRLAVYPTVQMDPSYTWSGLDDPLLTAQLASRRINLMVADGGTPGQHEARILRLRKHSFRTQLTSAWKHVEQAIQEQHDDQCWKTFARKYRRTFFASNPIEGFHVCDPRNDVPWAVQLKNIEILVDQLILSFTKKLPQH